MRPYKLLLFIAFIAGFCTLSCRKDQTFITSAGAKVSFSTDTLKFDTVFTQIGSATRFFKIFNPYSQSISINKIYLENNTNAVYRLNVDGVPGTSFTNVQILPNDSLYVFAEVTVNPNAPISASPFVIDANIVTRRRQPVKPRVKPRIFANVRQHAGRLGAAPGRRNAAAIAGRCKRARESAIATIWLPRF